MRCSEMGCCAYGTAKWAERACVWPAEERRQRFKTAGKGSTADSDAKAAEHASNAASRAADSASAAAAIAKADADMQKPNEVCACPYVLPDALLTAHCP